MQWCNMYIKWLIKLNSLFVYALMNQLFGTICSICVVCILYVLCTCTCTYCTQKAFNTRKQIYQRHSKWFVTNLRTVDTMQSCQSKRKLSMLREIHEGEEEEDYAHLMTYLCMSVVNILIQLRLCIHSQFDQKKFTFSTGLLTPRISFDQLGVQLSFVTYVSQMHSI